MVSQNSTATGAKKTISKGDWDEMLENIHVTKRDLNKLVMNYLVIEGYKHVAEKFMNEANLSPDLEVDSIEERMKIRTAVQNGDVELAINLVNELNPEILDTNPRLYFHLQQQRLIELIRTGQLVEALDFARDELAPRGEENTGFLEELERTMALLAFDDHLTSPVGYLLLPAQRQKTASELNAAILAGQCLERDPKLPVLVKLMVWAQRQLTEKATFPRITDAVNATLVEPDDSMVL